MNKLTTHPTLADWTDEQLEERYRDCERRVNELIDCGPPIGCGAGAREAGSQRLSLLDRLRYEGADIGSEMHLRLTRP